MMSLFGWGSCLDGQLGLGGIEEEKILVARTINGVNNGDERRVLQATCGLAHSLLLLQEGSVFSCGSNEFGQLGREGPTKRFRQVSAVSQVRVTQIACGAHFSAALTCEGRIYAWGLNTKGQLARSNLEDQSVQLITLMQPHVVVQLACGAEHMLSLTKASEIFVWGSNEVGQLGVGVIGQNHLVPLKLTSLYDVPVRQVACGGYFSFCLTVSGSLFAWGRNDVGQLGLGDTVNRALPHRCTSLKTQAVVRVSCGEVHSVFLTKDGGVFSCGGGGCGQLGHNSRSNVLVPTKIFELMGRDITQIACGRRHTMALMTSTGALMCFGLGASGQLGVGHTGDLTSPGIMKGPWVKPLANRKVAGPSLLDRRLSIPDLNEPLSIHSIFCGYGDNCFLTAEVPTCDKKPVDFRTPDRPAIEHLSAETLKALLRLPVLPSEPDAVSAMHDNVKASLSRVASMSISFIREDKHFNINAATPGVDLDNCCSVMKRFAALPTEDVLRNAVKTSLRNLLISTYQKNYPSPECLRIFLLLSQTFDVFLPNSRTSIIMPFCDALDTLDPIPKQYLERWFAVLPIRHTSKLLYAVKDSLTNVLKEYETKPAASAHAMPEPNRITDRSTISLLNILCIVHNSNLKREDTNLRSDSFYIDQLSDFFDIAAEYYHWLLARSSYKDSVSLCDYPFIFNGVAKTLMLRMDARIQMARAVEKVQAINFVALYNRTILFDMPELLFQIRRDHILEDTVTNLSRYNSSDLKKPLRVVFEGEEAQDEGGVKKEYLMLFFRTLLDPNFAMFKYYEETRMLWFHEHTFEEAEKFGLVGTMCGLSVYNNSLVDLNFPLAMYKKILSQKPNLDDVKDLDPSVGSSLQSLLDYENDDFEDVFCLTFSLNTESFGVVTTVDLKENGRNIPVTLMDKAEYVELYVDYLFNRSCDVNYEFFHKAFHQVFASESGSLLRFFEAEELQTLLVGNEEYDWESLKSGCTYKDEYWSGHPVIIWFWESFSDFPLDKKKKFLFFLTGSDRVPIQGMKAIKMFIQPNAADDAHLPVAHTCFNLLDLPKYSTKEILTAKLKFAIEQTEGFGLI